MKILFLTIIVFVTSLSHGQTCKPLSPEMSQYMAQRHWRAFNLGDGKNGISYVRGYVDPQNNFYFDDLSRTGEVTAEIIADSENTNSEVFDSLCKDGSSKLYWARTLRAGNRYKAKARYLPAFPLSSNNPFNDQAYTDDELTFQVKVEDDSLTRQHDYSARRTINWLENDLSDQLKKSKAFGEVELDLTNLDDVVCDLLTKKLKLTLVRKGRSRHPLVQQKTQTKPEDLRTVYTSLKKELKSSTSPEHTIFLAGRTVRHLENQRVISSWGLPKGFEILKKLMNPELTQLKSMDTQALACLADQLQDYKRGTLTHVINVGLNFEGSQQ